MEGVTIATRKKVLKYVKGIIFMVFFFKANKVTFNA